MRCMVTGATGLIGTRLVRELLQQDFQVNVLVRSPGKLAEDVSEQVNMFQGDILDKTSINNAVKGCSAVFHLAAFAGIWAKDKMLPYRVNVTGTRNILEAALKNDVGKVVYTSSAGTLSPSQGGIPVNENMPMPESYNTDYEMSKRQAEQLFC
ncbi:MAG: SDR family NAD(P)-dependent oxidoreductase [Mariniphaga sp.]